MAIQVPRIEGPSIRSSVTPSAQLTARMDANPLAGFGQALGGINGLIAKEKAKADDARVMDASRQLSSWQSNWFDPENAQGVYSYKGADALKLNEAILPDYDKTVADIRKNLQPSQQATFDELAARQRERLDSQVLSHMVSENEQYQQSALKAHTQTSINDAVDAIIRGDRAGAGSILGEGLTFLDRNAALNGLSAEEASLRKQSMVSAVHSAALDHFLATDPLKAKDYFDENVDRLLPQDRAQAEAKLQPLVIDAKGDAFADAAITGRAPVAGIESLANAVFHVESNGKHMDASGALTISPKGAKGISQVMPKTGADPGFGVQPLQNQSEAEYRRFGRDYLQAMLLEFNGDTAKAVAAYNAGPAAVKKAESRGTNWLSALPAETQAYVPKVLGQGVTGTPVSEAQALATTESIQDKRVQAAAREKIAFRYRLSKMQEDDNKRSVSQNAWMAIESANPGTPLRQVLSPDVYVFAAGQGWLPGLEARMKQRAEGINETSSPETLNAAREMIYRASLGNNEAMSSLRAFNAYDPSLSLSTADRKQLAKDQVDLLSENQAKKNRVATESQIDRLIIQYRRNILGISDKEAISGKKSTKAIEFDQSMRAWVDSFSQKNSRSPTYTELQQHADELTISNLEGTYETPGAIFGNAWTNKESFKLADIGATRTELAQMAEALRAQGQSVTAENIARMWSAYQRKTK